MMTRRENYIKMVGLLPPSEHPSLVEVAFKQEMADAVHEGTKTETTRTRKKGSPGDYFLLDQYSEWFMLTAVRQHTLGWIFKNRWRFEGFKSEQAFREYYAKLMRGHPVYDNDLGWIHSFEPMTDDILVDVKSKEQAFVDAAKLAKRKAKTGKDKDDVDAKVKKVDRAVKAVKTPSQAKLVDE